MKGAWIPESSLGGEPPGKPVHLHQTVSSVGNKPDCLRPLRHGVGVLEQVATLSYITHRVCDARNCSSLYLFASSDLHWRLLGKKIPPALMSGVQTPQARTHHSVAGGGEAQ